MKNFFLFKRGNFYHLQYLEETENRIKRVSTGCKTKNDAIKFLIKFQENKADKTRLTFITLSQFIELYKSYIKENYSRKYYISVSHTLKHFNLLTGNIPLNKITSFQTEKFIIQKFSESNHTAKQYFLNLRSAFNKAITWNYIKDNPTKNIKLPKIPKNNPIFIDEVELNQIINQEPDQQLKDMYLFAFHTGMRLGEIVNLTWNTVDLIEGIINVTNTVNFTTKGKKERVIPINDRIQNLLSKRLPKIISIEKSEYVFNNHGMKFNDEYISKKFKCALRKVKTINQAFHFHDLRHSFASNLVIKGVPIYTVMELLGHQDIKTTQIYSHLKVENLKEAVKVLEG